MVYRPVDVQYPIIEPVVTRVKVSLVLRIVEAQQSRFPIGFLLPLSILFMLLTTR